MDDEKLLIAAQKMAASAPAFGEMAARVLAVARPELGKTSAEMAKTLSGLCARALRANNEGRLVSGCAFETGCVRLTVQLIEGEWIELTADVVLWEPTTSLSEFEEENN